MSSEHLEGVFNRFMLQVKVCAAVRFLTVRSGCGILDQESEACGKSGLPGKKVLMFKRRESSTTPN